MKKLDNKGFTLVEVLAIVIILGVLIAIMIPNINNLINKNKEDSYKQLLKSFENAAKIYTSDYRYDIKLNTNNNCNDEGITELNVISISTTNLIESKISLNVLVTAGALEISKDGNIYNPMNNEMYLDLENSYVTIKYICKTKDYSFKISNPETDLKWKNL